MATIQVWIAIIIALYLTLTFHKHETYWKWYLGSLPKITREYQEVQLFCTLVFFAETLIEMYTNIQLFLICLHGISRSCSSFYCWNIIQFSLFSNVVLKFFSRFRQSNLPSECRWSVSISSLSIILPCSNICSYWILIRLLNVVSMSQLHLGFIFS